MIPNNSFSLGFKTGNPQVRFSHTVPMPGMGAYWNVILKVWLNFETHGYFSLK